MESYRTERIYTRSLTDAGILHWKNWFNCTSILLFDLFTVYSVNKGDWDFGTGSRKPPLKSHYFKNNVRELRGPEIWLFSLAAINTS